jgi:glycerol-3-phosphate dehydrogenase (NAD(P)+)
MRMVAEGIRTSESTARLADRMGVEMPIANQVYSILYDGKNLEAAIAELMERELKEE